MNTYIMEDQMNFSDADCMDEPSAIQKRIMENHEDLSDFNILEVAYHKNGLVVFLRIDESRWITLVATEVNTELN